MHETGLAAAGCDAPLGGMSADDCRRRIAHLSGALDAVAEGVVITDERGAEVYRNATARELTTVQISGSLAGTAITEQLAAARTTGPNQRVLELFVPIRRVLLIRAAPLCDEVGLTGSVAVVEDVSERRRVDAIRRDFVANVSHELKTPVGALSLLAETLDGEDDPEIITRLSERITMEAERLACLIDDLLDLSRIEANEAPLREDVAVQAIMAEAVDAVRPHADVAGIALEVADDAGTLFVSGDRWELVSALKNLVDNAVKYTERGGQVVVGSRRAGDRRVELSVADTGIGIPARDLGRIFERFYRVDRARSRSTGGTGLGLAIVRHVAANHGGEIRVDSEEGVGSTFTLVLPSSPVAARAGGSGG